MKRIKALWQTTAWPVATDVYAKAGYQRAFGYYLKRIRHLGLSGGLLVDAGCGGGRWSFAWATTFDRVIGFDIADRRIDAANWQRERFDVPAVDFITGNVRKIPIDDESADALYCNDVISGAPSIEPALHEFFRVLKAGGICYIRMIGLDSAQERARSGNPRLAEVARRRIYNTLCQRHLMPLVSVIGPGLSRNVEAAACLQRVMPPTDLLTSLKCRPDQIMAAQTIADDLGPEFSQQLLDDLAAIHAGTKTSFGERAAGRVWAPDEVSVAATDAGFGRIEWAPDGWLSLKRDGSIEKAPCDNTTPGGQQFEDRPCAFEMLMWKPPRRSSWANNRSDVSLSRSDGGAKIIERASKVGWKTTLGLSTYWNARSKTIVSPIIETLPPALTELDNAIITKRSIVPTTGDVRFFTGGIYDCNHNLLPSFMQREAYEVSQSKLIRMANDPVLLEEALVDADVLYGEYIYLGILRNHFGHFLLETLSHVWYLLRVNRNIKVLFHQYENLGNVPSFANYIFKLLDLTQDRIIVVTRNSIVEKLFFPDSEFEVRWKARVSYADTFRELFERSARLFPVRPTPRQIYLTRRHLNVENERNPRRIVNNEADLESLFAESGFTIVAPEKLPLHEQIAIVGGADQIAGLKGSALHMSLFCQRPKARIIQLVREQAINQSLIDGLKNMENHQIFYEFTAAETGSLVDLEVIRAAMREM